MKRNKKILIGIVVGLIIIISFLFIYNKINKSSFVIQIRGDLTSSGAQRNYDASLTFVDNILIEGTESYYVGQGGGCTTDCERVDSCKILNGRWVDSGNGSDCRINYPFIPSTTKEGIERQIKSKELKPMNKCGRFDICYEILDISRINDGKPGYSGGSMGNQNN